MLTLLLTFAARAADPDAWADAMLAGVEFGQTTKAQLVQRLGPPATSYTHTDTATVEVFEGGSVPGLATPVRRFFLVESDRVMAMRFDSGGAPVKDAVEAAFAAWKPLPVPGSPTLEAICALPKKPQVSLLLTWEPTGALAEGVFGPRSRWTLRQSPCP